MTETVLKTYPSTIPEQKRAEVGVSHEIASFEKAGPYLDHLAELLLETDKDRWNVIIGDDAGGRLPAHFIHRVLKNDGRSFSTFFVVGSSRYRDAQGEKPYQEYFQSIADHVGEPLRPLIVTESVGSGGTVDFLRQSLLPFCGDQLPEVAAVAAEPESLDSVDYVGGATTEALSAVFNAFESPNPKTFKQKILYRTIKAMPLSSATKANAHKELAAANYNRVVGIGPDIDSERPIAKIVPARNAALASLAFKVMDQRAQKIR